MLSHDLKNPLTPLAGLLPMIKEKEQDTKMKEMLDISIHFIIHILLITINIYNVLSFWLCSKCYGQLYHPNRFQSSYLIMIARI